MKLNKEVEMYFKDLFLDEITEKLENRKRYDGEIDIEDVWENEVKSHLFNDKPNGGKLIYMMEYLVEEGLEDSDWMKWDEIAPQLTK